jgi:hypothetical protein
MGLPKPLCRAAAARSVPSVTKQTPQKTFYISCRRHPPLVAASPRWVLRGELIWIELSHREIIRKKIILKVSSAKSAKDQKSIHVIYIIKQTEACFHAFLRILRALRGYF